MTMPIKAVATIKASVTPTPMPAFAAVQRELLASEACNPDCAVLVGRSVVSVLMTRFDANDAVGIAGDGRLSDGEAIADIFGGAEAVMPAANNTRGGSYEMFRLLDYHIG